MPRRVPADEQLGRLRPRERQPQPGQRAARARKNASSRLPPRKIAKQQHEHNRRAERQFRPKGRQADRQPCRAASASTNCERLDGGGSGVMRWLGINGGPRLGIAVGNLRGCGAGPASCSRGGLTGSPSFTFVPSSWQVESRNGSPSLHVIEQCLRINAQQDGKRQQRHGDANSRGVIRVRWSPCGPLYSGPRKTR